MGIGKEHSLTETVEYLAVLFLCFVEVVRFKAFFRLRTNNISSPQDVHSRYRTEAHQDVVGRFNER